MKEGGACRLFASALLADVAGVGHIIVVKFWVKDVVQDVYGERAEAGGSLLLDLQVRARLRGPVNQELPDRAGAPRAFSTRRQFDGAKPELCNL